MLGTFPAAAAPTVRPRAEHLADAIVADVEALAVNESLEDALASLRLRLSRLDADTLELIAPLTC